MTSRRWVLSGLVTVPLLGIFMLLVGLPFLYFNGIESLLDPSHVYYRVAVTLDYKGQPVELNAVVDCDIRHTRPLGGARNIEFSYEPDYYGVRLPDGAGAFIKVGSGTDCLWAYKKLEDPDDLERLGWTQADTLTGFPTAYWVSDFEKQDYAEVHFSAYSYTTPSARFRLISGTTTLASARDYRAFVASTDNNPAIIRGNYYGDELDRTKSLTRLTCLYAVRLEPSLWQPVAGDIPDIAVSTNSPQIGVISGHELEPVKLALYPLIEDTPSRRRLWEYARGQFYPAIRTAVPALETIAAYVSPVSVTDVADGAISVTATDNRRGIVSCSRHSGYAVTSYRINGEQISSMDATHDAPLFLDRRTLSLVWLQDLSF